MDRWMDGRMDGWMDGWMDEKKRRWKCVDLLVFAKCLQGGNGLAANHLLRASYAMAESSCAACGMPQKKSQS